MSGTSGGVGRSKEGVGFLRDGRGQSETIGVVLILGMVILGMSAVIGFGSQALDATEQRSEVANVEQAMAQFDSKAAQVALGDSAVQSVPLGSGGTYRVEPDVGTITITHANHVDGTNNDGNSVDDGPSDDDQLIRSVDLGSVVYEADGTTIAYQGGGVWRKDAAGASRMISPPEFHYRDETLTLPVIDVTTAGTQRVAGAPRGVITDDSGTGTESVYPDTSGEPNATYDVTGEPYANPVQNGIVVIEVRSRYYEGWAEYFETRTEGNISVTAPATPGDPGVARVELDAPPRPTNPFELPEQGNAIDLRGVGDEHPIDAFSISLADPGNSNGFKHLYWSFHAQSGNRKFELLFYSADKQRCKNGRDTAPLYVGVYYQDAMGAIHEWENAAVDPDTGPIRIVCQDIDNDGKDEPRLNATIIPEANPKGGASMRYTELTTPADKWVHDPSGEADSRITFDEHVSDPETTFYKGADSAPLGSIVDHYLSLLGPEVALTVSETSPCGCRIDEDDSFGRLEYTPSGGQYITYLHVTENEVTVELE